MEHLAALAIGSGVLAVLLGIVIVCAKWPVVAVIPSVVILAYIMGKAVLESTR